MPHLTDQQRLLLHWLGHFYLCHGQPRRALVLLMLAARHASKNDHALLCAIVMAMLDLGMPDRASEVMSWIDDRNENAIKEPGMFLLRARVHWLAGEQKEARRLFRQFVKTRLDRLSDSESQSNTDAAPAG